MNLITFGLFEQLHAVIFVASILVLHMVSNKLRISILVWMCMGLSTGNLESQKVIDWQVLSDVTFHPVYVDDLGYEIDSAAFGQNITAYQGENVMIRGYMIPLDAMGTSYALSRNPNASCFFCGGAGPETVIQLNLKPTAIRRYQMDAVLTFRGRLRMNEKNADQFTYVLEGAEPAS